MRKRLTILGMFATAFLGSASPCAAQYVPYVELSGGYNFMRFQQAQSGQNLNGGVYGDVAINLNSAIGVVGLVTANTHAASDDVRLVGLMGGLRFTRRGFGRGAGHTVGFVHLLGGLLGNKVGTVSYFDRGMDIGGGVNVSVTNEAAVRIEADYLRTFQQQNPNIGDNYLRFAAGFVFGFGAH